SPSGRRRTWSSSSNCSRRSRFSRRRSIPPTDQVKSARFCGRGRGQVNPELASTPIPFHLRSTGGRHRGCEFHEEIVRCFLCRAVDEALSELRQLAADLRLHVICEERAAVLVRKRNLGAAFCKPGDAPLPFAGNAIAVGWIEVGEPYLALPARLDRTDLHRGDGLKLVFRNPVELLAARNAAFEHFGIVELRPDHFPAGGKLDLPVHGHRHQWFSIS